MACTANTGVVGVAAGHEGGRHGELGCREIAEERGAGSVVPFEVFCS